MQAEGARVLPWFGAVQGFSLVPPEGSCGSGGSGEMAALILLSEGGQLMVHDLRTLQPVPLSLPFQELPPVTASAFAPGEPLAGEVRFCLINIIIYNILDTFWEPPEAHWANNIGTLLRQRQGASAGRCICR